MSIIARQSAGSDSATLPMMPMPAFATTMSRLPSCVDALVDEPLRIAAASRTSAATPDGSAARARGCQPRPPADRSASRLTTHTAAPSAASRVAMPRPIPLVAPVTSAT